MPKQSPPSKMHSFWFLQLSGWLLYFTLNAVSSIPYRHRPDYLAFRGGFLVSGFLASFLVYWLCRYLWRRQSSIAEIAVSTLLFSYPLGMACSAAAFWAGSVVLGKWSEFNLGAIITGAPSGTFVLIAWCAFYFGIKHYLALEEKHRQLVASESLAREAQLRALRYQLEPHFLFNTLNAISTLVLDNQPKIATQMISRLAGLLRNTLESPHSHHVSLAEEISVAEEYLAMEELRFGPKLKVHTELDPLVMQARVPRLILQPLVENAVRHGIARIPRGGNISIRASARGSSLTVCVENEVSESAAVSISMPRTSGGVGLTNVRDRLEQLYGKAGRLHAERNLRGNYEASITLPLECPRRDADAELYGA
jgi:two-component sensor histidine kinase